VTRETPGGLEVREGWLRSGDLGRRRADGTLEFRGVSKSMFTRNGYNIYPREIERAIAELPSVKSVRVSAVPDPVKENAIVVDVSGDVTIEEVRNWAALRLGAYKQPSVINVNA
jgi:acyl-CoA synthetase (AMP-forming)/AMP-acid ligase II